MSQKTNVNVAYATVAALGVLILRDAWERSKLGAEIPYSEFQQLLKEQKIAEVVISSNQLQGALVEPHGGKSRFVTTRVETDLAEALDRAGVRYSRRMESTAIPTLLSWVVPVILSYFLR